MTEPCINRSTAFIPVAPMTIKSMSYCAGITLAIMFLGLPVSLMTVKLVTPACFASVAKRSKSALLCVIAFSSNSCE